VSNPFLFLGMVGRQAVRLRGPVTSTEGAGPPRKRATEPRCTSGHFEQEPGRLQHSLYHAGRGNKDYKPRRQGIAVYRDPGGFYVYLVVVRLTVASLPYLTAGVSSSPVLEPLSHVKAVGRPLPPPFHCYPI
jgi:hypothetical protein